MPIISKSLGHKNSSTTETYARLMMDPVRESADEAVSVMLATAKTAGKRKSAQRSKNNRIDASAILGRHRGRFPRSFTNRPPVPTPIPS